MTYNYFQRNALYIAQSMRPSLKCCCCTWYSRLGGDDFDFEMVNFPFLDGDVSRSTSYGVFISQLIRFARASSYVADFQHSQ